MSNTKHATQVAQTETQETKKVVLKQETTQAQAQETSASTETIIETLKALYKRKTLENVLKFNVSHKYESEKNTSVMYLTNDLIEIYKTKANNFYIYSAVKLETLKDKLAFISSYKNEKRKFRYEIENATSDNAKLLASAIATDYDAFIDIVNHVEEIANLTARN